MSDWYIRQNAGGPSKYDVKKMGLDIKLRPLRHKISRVIILFQHAYDWNKFEISLVIYPTLHTKKLQIY